MKRILTLALAAILVVAFAIPTFAAPKIELVGGAVKTHVAISDVLGTQTGPLFGALKFKLSADNFVFNVTTAYNTPTIGGFGPQDWNDVTLGIVNYNFALDLPFMTLSGVYDEFTASFGYHAGHEVRLASNESFQEALGFNWAVYYNDDNLSGAFESLHANISVPVGEAFTGTVEYTYEDIWLDLNDDTIVDAGETFLHHAKLDLVYAASDDLRIEVIASKNITSATNDFLFATMVDFPIVEGFSGTFWAQYGMAGYAADTDYAIGMGYFSGYAGDTVEGLLVLAYNNENSNATFVAAYYDDTDFTVNDGNIYAMAEYVSDGANTFWSSNTLRATYANTTDSRGRGWNSQYKWVRDNKGNEFAVRADATLTFVPAADPTYSINGYAMFAPDVVPVVLTLKGNYSSTGDWNVRNWIGVRVNGDIHLALYDRYVVTGGVGEFNLDAALVYNKDSVTASLTGANLLTTWGLDLFVGISF